MIDDAARAESNAPTYEIANFAVRVLEAHGGEALAHVQQSLETKGAIDNLSDLKSSLGLSSGREVFSQRVPIPPEFLRALDTDEKLRQLWFGPEGTADTYGGAQVFRDGIDLIKDVEHYLLWVAVGLQYINVRVSIEKQTSSNTKTEVSFGTNGLSIAFKKQLSDFLTVAHALSTTPSAPLLKIPL